MSITTDNPSQSVITPQHVEDVAAALGGAVTSHSELLVAGLAKLEASAGQIESASVSQHGDVIELQQQVSDLSHGLIRAHDKLTNELTSRVNDLQGVVAKSLEASNTVLEAALEQAGRRSEPTGAMAQLESGMFQRISAVETQVQEMGALVLAIAAKLGVEETTTQPEGYVTHTKYTFDDAEADTANGVDLERRAELPATAGDVVVPAQFGGSEDDEVVVFSPDPTATYSPPVAQEGYKFATALAEVQLADSEAQVEEFASLRHNDEIGSPAAAFGADVEATVSNDPFVLPDDEEYY